MRLRVKSSFWLELSSLWTGAGLIATAHTASDNVETILFHLARGSGLRGLGGILPKREEIIRPLLTTTRPQVEDYLRRHSLPHMEDSSQQGAEVGGGTVLVALPQPAQQQPKRPE